MQRYCRNNPEGAGDDGSVGKFPKAQKPCHNWISLFIQYWGEVCGTQYLTNNVIPTKCKLIRKYN